MIKHNKLLYCKKCNKKLDNLYNIMANKNNELEYYCNDEELIDFNFLGSIQITSRETFLDKQTKDLIVFYDEIYLIKISASIVQFASNFNDLIIHTNKIIPTFFHTLHLITK